jgi:hypothetical protein
MTLMLKDLKAGDVLIADDGFTCVKSGEVILEADEDGELFFKCSGGGHWLNGQVADDGSIIGLTRKVVQ